MALRELLKSGTSADYQASFNNYFKDDQNADKQNEESGASEELEKRKLENEEEVACKKLKEDVVEWNIIYVFMLFFFLFFFTTCYSGLIIILNADLDY